MEYKQFKQIIDNARAILVGKLPSPVAQVDAISYALIYKFMSDNDDESAALGGKRVYFSGEYEKYGWHELMNPSVSGHDRVLLYREALEKMSRNPNLPPLFREIFNNATLTFNDPNTLNLFLGEIDKIKHDSGDSIGDAYEYLLSTMGSQGDLGQFRTPRHIINFIVELVDPDKTDKILDPACGTAGFLISAYKHLMKKYNEDNRLTSEEKEKIHHNFYGFDIEPNMTRIARVNMFLHGFKSPNIIEHDTLSSEDYWDDRYNVIIANPPFMTPKGGIVPHKKFSITSKKAELLFVDYIASHLKPEGRAAVIVPDGVLFGSSTAHKTLRKELVDNQKLVAVISMPSGVFKPYAGVSTAILVFTKTNNGGTDKVWFYDMKADGFSLDDKRSAIKENDIPDILERFHHLDAENDRKRTDQSFFVDKAEIVKNNYDLSINKYKEIEYEKIEYPPTEEILADIEKLNQEIVDNLAELKKLFKHDKFGFVGMKVKLGDLTKIKTGKLDANASSKDGQYPFFTCSKEPLKISSYSYDCECVLVAGNGDLNVKYYNGKFDAYQRTYIIESNGDGRIYLPYLYHFMSQYVDELRRLSIGGVIKYIKLGGLANAEIELPTISEQKRICNNLRVVKSILFDEQEQIAQLDTLIKARFVEMFDTVDLASRSQDWVKISDIGEVVSGSTPKTSNPGYWDGDICWISPAELTDMSGVLMDSQKKITQAGKKSCSLRLQPVGTVVLSSRAPIGKVAILGTEMCCNQGFKNIICGERILPKYLYYLLGYNTVFLNMLGRGATFREISKKIVEDIRIPLPSIRSQNQFINFTNQVDKSKFAIQTTIQHLQCYLAIVIDVFFASKKGLNNKY